MLGGFLGGLANLGTAYGGYLGAQNQYLQNQLRQQQLQDAQAQQALQEFAIKNPQVFGQQTQPGTTAPSFPSVGAGMGGPAPLQPLIPVQAQPLPAPLPQVPSATAQFGAPIPGLAALGGDPSTGGMGGGTAAGSPFGPGQALTGPTLSGTGISPLAGFGTGLPSPRGELAGDPSLGLGRDLPLADVPGPTAPQQVSYGGLGPGPDQTTGFMAPSTLGQPQIGGLSVGIQPPSGALDFGPMPRVPAMQGPTRPQAPPARPDLGGTQNLLPQYDTLGATRPLGPGEYVMNSDGSWSSEYSVTVEDPNRPGQYMVVPSLWLVNGKPQILSEDQAAQTAADSRLNFPRFGTEQAAEAFSTRREQGWQQVPVGRSDMQPALWSRPAGGAAVPADDTKAQIAAGQGGYRQIVQIESGGNMDTSRVGAYGEIGPAQITPDTWKQYSRPGEDIRNPNTNLEVGKRVYNDLMQKSGGDYAATLVGYNRGEGAMRRFQQAGDNLDALRGTSMMPTAAYQRAIRQAGGRGGGDSAEVVNMHAEMGSNLSPEQHGIGDRGLQMILTRMPQIPQAIQMMKPSDLAQLIQQSFPGTSDAVKGAVFLKALPLMNEVAKEQTAQAWQGWKAQMEQLEDVMKWRHEAATEDKERFGQPENFIDTATGQPVLGRAVQMSGGRVGVVDASGRMLDASQLRKPFPGEETQAKFGTVDDLMAKWRTDYVRETGHQPSTDEIAKKRSEFAGEVKPEGKGVLTEAQAEYWAKVISEGGALPPGVARDKATIQQIMRHTGETGDPGDFILKHSEVKADTGSLNRMQAQTDAIESFSKTANDNLDAALRLAKGAVPTNLGPMFNKWVETGMTQFGDVRPGTYQAALLSAANEAAKVLSGSTGAAGATVSGREEVERILSPYLSAGQIEGAAGVLKQEMRNRIGNLHDQVNAIKARLRGGGEPAAPPPREPEPTPAREAGGTAAMEGDTMTYKGKTYHVGDTETDSRGHVMRWNGGSTDNWEDLGPISRPSPPVR